MLNFTIFFVDKNPGTYALWVWLFMFCEGGHFTLLPNILRRIYGSKATQMYGWFGNYPSLCSIITIYMYKWFLIPGDVKSYNNFFIFNGVLSILALIILNTAFTQDQYVPKSCRKLI